MSSPGQPEQPEGPSIAQLAYEAWAGAYVADGLAKAVPWAALELADQEGWHAAVNTVQLETVRATQRAHGAAPG